MAAKQLIDVRARSAAPPGAVWALLADTPSWPRWSPVEQAERTRDGEGDPEGVGSQRVFRTGRVRNEEEIVRFEPGRALSYRVIGGNLPLRDYRADVTLTPSGDGTDIVWRSVFRSKYPGLGGFVRRRLRGFIQETADGLARAAEGAPPASA